MQKRLQKSRTNVVLTGTLAGIAEYFGIDPTIVRVIYVFLSFGLIGAPVVLYVLLALVIPAATTIMRKKRHANVRKRTKSTMMTGATFNDLPTALNS